MKLYSKKENMFLKSTTEKPYDGSYGLIHFSRAGSILTQE